MGRFGNLAGDQLGLAKQQNRQGHSYPWRLSCKFRTSAPTGAILTSLLQVNENIRVGDHCFVYEIGVNKGNSGNMTPGSITNLLSAARSDCRHGGRWSLNFVAGDGDIIGRGWLKADPQKNSDCS